MPVTWDCWWQKGVGNSGVLILYDPREEQAGDCHPLETSLQALTLFFLFNIRPLILERNEPFPLVYLLLESLSRVAWERAYLIFDWNSGKTNSPLVIISVSARGVCRATHNPSSLALRMLVKCCCVEAHFLSPPMMMAPWSGLINLEDFQSARWAGPGPGGWKI